MIKTYRKGARYERKIVKEYKEKGWLALRSAGSKSPIDVVAINPITKQIRLIQCKTNINKTKARKIEEAHPELTGLFYIEFIAI